MFTGLISSLGVVEAITKGSEYAKLTIKDAKICGQIAIGDSVSVNGTCLSVTEFDTQSFVVDVMAQTLKVSAIGSLTKGDLVNLELATKAGQALGGHIVQGHVDCIGKVIEIKEAEKWVALTVTIPAEKVRYVVPQGSIAIDGVSLTVGEVDDSKNTITVWLIPQTLALTNLGKKSPDDLVNIEVDILAKYVERLVNKAPAGDK
ncbi:MAG: riboflavin synthase [Actinobacteria bacterium]|nr:riboflavin synthase [Actinomycetota bacterium]